MSCSDPGDGGAAFQTPLATLHAHNGWADAFLVTPSNGLEDYFLQVGGSVPYELGGRSYKVNGKLVYHWFFEHSGGNRLGHELDAVVFQNWNEHVASLLKYAYFDGDTGFADRNKIWIQMELKF